MKKILFHTTASWEALILRTVLGSVIFAHGAQKLLGWFGGYGFTGTMNYFTGTVGLPWIVGLLVIILEFFGALSLVIGFATRIVAGSLALIAAGIIFTTSHSDYFFMNWFGNQAGEGYEYFLLWIAIAVALVLSGGGRYALDSKL